MSSKSARSTFSVDEITRVIPRFPLPRIDRVEELAVGSSRSPKLILHTIDGVFLLKRRADEAGREDRVRFTQAVQLELERRGVPVARLIRTRGGGAPALHLDGFIYEVFEFVQGDAYQALPEQALSAGRAIGSFHHAMWGWEPPVPSPVGNYHGASGMPKLLERARETTLKRALKSDDAVDAKKLDEALASIAGAYRVAGTKVDLGDAPPRVVCHADFHPGNAIFASDGTVRALIDFDSARIEDPILDLSNALLQFGNVRRRTNDPTKWPLEIDFKLAEAVVTGYCSACNTSQITARAGAVPWLMVEAVVAESAVPLARTGRMGNVVGSKVLDYLRTRVDWIVVHSGRLATLVESCARPFE